MSKFWILIITFWSYHLFAADPGELIFSDDFGRSESQEEKDEPGGEWGTNSAKRAKGDKQVDLRDGAMYIFISEKADHGVSVTHPAEFTDGKVALRFKLEDKKDSLGLNFADLKCQEVHAGHLFAVRIYPHSIRLEDLKTGKMKMEIREARQAGTLSAEAREALKEKEKTFKNQLAIGEWHEVEASVSGETLSVSIDGEEVGSFDSPGIAHPTKRTLRLAVPRNAVVDDVRIWRAK